ncbi:glycosyltransferase family 2 protein [Ruthenibacterium lactatiformans]|uniref:glycosyltransferase family 2 protein n=1 Tax=Ruthenibacterium lactatiformans TaxID=1550024 RepID=UPI00399F10B6
MKASIVIPNLNGAGWLRDSIESVWAQTEQDFELIIIDNGSTDESLAIARSYVGRSGYTLVENQTNTGFSAAVNTGIGLAKGEYVVLFNNDAFAQPDWLAQLIAMADAEPRAFAVQSLMIRHFERDICDDAGDYVTLFGWACKRGDGMYWRRYTKPGRIFSACGGASLYRKSILDEIGLFDELFFAYFEDVDISWRANSLGYKNLYCPAAKCYHICGATTGAVRYNEFKSVQSGRNSILLPYKNMPLGMLLLNFIRLRWAICSKFWCRPAGLLDAVHQRRAGGVPGHPESEKAEIPVAQSAPLRAHRAVAGGGCVPLHRLPHHAVF